MYPLLHSFLLLNFFMPLTVVTNLNSFLVIQVSLPSSFPPLSPYIREPFMPPLLNFSLSVRLQGPSHFALWHLQNLKPVQAETSSDFSRQTENLEKFFVPSTCFWWS